MGIQLKSRKALFWDIDEKDIETAIVNSKDWVVLRVFEYGTLEEIFEVIDLYGKDLVSKILRSSQHLKPVTKAMGKLFLELDLK